LTMPSSDARRCAIRLMRLPPSTVDRAARQSAGPLLIAATEAGAARAQLAWRPINSSRRYSSSRRQDLAGTLNRLEGRPVGLLSRGK
jgi:hypothetical protein